MRFALDILRCPNCLVEEDLIKDCEELQCRKCGSVFPIDKDVPILLEKKRSQALYDNYFKNRGKRWGDLSPKNRYEFKRTLVKTKIRILDNILNFLRYPYSPTPLPPNYRNLHERFMTDGLALNLSGGHTSLQIDGWINMDILDYETVDVVGDGVNVPFRSNTFKLIVCNSVLEHIEDYQKVIDECYRVLQSGGYFYLCVPQVCGQHHLLDYRRWTMPGLLRDMRQFSIVEKGIRNGPGVFLPIILEAIIEASALPGILKEAARTLGLWLTYPLRFTDKIAKDKELLANYSHTIYVLGRKLK